MSNNKNKKNSDIEIAKQRILAEKKKDPKAFEKKYGGKQPTVQNKK